MYNPLCVSQVDEPTDLADGSVPGVKNAAVRKLYHELGIPAEHLRIDSFKFLTRLHYYAADALTHGPNSPWGEHEIDYILFIQVSFVAYSLQYTAFQWGMILYPYFVIPEVVSVRRQCRINLRRRPLDKK